MPRQRRVPREVHSYCTLHRCDGKIAPSNKIYVVECENQTQTGGAQEDCVKIISPTAQAVEMAKAKDEREIDTEGAGGMQRGIKSRAPMRGGSSGKRRLRVQTNKKRKGKKKRKWQFQEGEIAAKVRRDLLGIY